MPARMAAGNATGVSFLSGTTRINLIQRHVPPNRQNLPRRGAVSHTSLTLRLAFLPERLARLIRSCESRARLGPADHRQAAPQPFNPSRRCLPTGRSKR
jgi:hypothetical protein